MWLIPESSPDVDVFVAILTDIYDIFFRYCLGRILSKKAYILVILLIDDDIRMRYEYSTNSYPLSCSYDTLHEMEDMESGMGCLVDAFTGYNVCQNLRGEGGQQVVSFPQLLHILIQTTRK